MGRLDRDVVTRIHVARAAARAMGHDGNFRIPVSDTQAYKQIGNSAAVPVFVEVARLMRPHILALAEGLGLRKVG